MSDMREFARGWNAAIDRVLELFPLLGSMSEAESAAEKKRIENLKYPCSAGHWV
jgi:hypothetical protein